MNKINVREVITENEFALMQSYINAYAGTTHSPAEPLMPIADILDNVWATNKYKLYKAFGEQLILSKRIEYKQSEDELYEVIYQLRENQNSAFYHFYHNYWDKVDSINAPIRYDDWTYQNPLRLFWDYFGSDEYILKNRCDRTMTLPLPNGKTIKVAPDTKVMKVFRELAEAYEIAGFEEFRLEHSRLLNAAKLKGEFCLSIHPLDYITMSENDNKWQSCMNWHQIGCYRRGTVEMMNSPVVVVAYLKSSTDMERFGFTWNNKKWRQLIVVESDIISSIKSYPYQNGDLSTLAVEWLAELMGESFKDQSVKTCYYDGELFESKSEKSLRTSFCTNTMYNDFGADVPHYVVTARNFDDSIWGEINYSGPAQCMFCGEFMPEFDDDCPAQYLVCGRCGSPTVRCEHCGSFHFQEEMVEFNGQTWCEYCYDRQTSLDMITGERHDRRDMIYVHVSKGEADHRYQWRYWAIGTIARENKNTEAWLANYPRLHTTDNSMDPWSAPWYYIDYNECNDEQKEKLQAAFNQSGMYGSLLEFLNTI